MLRLGGRAVELYAAQILITMIAIAMLAASATLLDNPLLLEWHNAAAVFYDPILTHIGLATLTHHLGYFDILPLYVVLMAMAPIFAIIDRYAPNWLLPLSLALYLAALIVPLPVPTWPVEGQWFFNPLAWQLVFVLGFVMAREDGVGGFVRRHIVPIRWLAVPIVAVSAYIVWNRMWPDPTLMPQPRLLFIADKTYVTPMRLIQFLALMALFSATYPYIKRWAGLARRVRLDAGSQLADRVLRRLDPQPRRADHTLRLPWRYRGRHRCGSFGYRHHGVLRMASGMARAGQITRIGAGRRRRPDGVADRWHASSAKARRRLRPPHRRR